MLKMRLQRVGRKNSPSYRVVVTDSRTGPKSGKHVDLLGSYDPKVNRVQIDGDRAKEWIAKGVQPSPTVHNILVGQKIIDGKKVNVLPKKSPIASEEAPAEEATPAAAESADTEPATEESADTTEEPKEESASETTDEQPAEEPTSEEAAPETQEDATTEEESKEEEKPAA